MFDKLSKNYDIPKVIKMHNGTSNMISRKGIMIIPGLRTATLLK